MIKLTHLLSALTAGVILTAAAAAQTGPAAAPKLKDEMRLPWTRQESSRCIRTWLLLGEFPNPARKGLDTDYLTSQGGEAKIVPAAGMTHQRPDGTTAAWKEFTSPVDIVDLTTTFPGRPGADVVAYAYTTVERPAAGKALLSLGSDDGVAIWLNGQRVFYNPASRGASPDQDQVEVDMQAGTNRLLLKVDQSSGGWGFVLRVLDAGGVRRAAPLAARLIPSDPGTVILASNPGTDPAQTARFEVMRAGGKIVAVESARRGEQVAFNSAKWPDGAYDVRVTVQDWQGKYDRAFLTIYKGDAQAAATRLIETAPKAPVATPEQGHHAMLAEMAKDRIASGSRNLPNVLLEFEELQQQIQGGPGPVHSSGFVRLAYQDDVDGSTQFCRAYLPATYDPAKRWPLVIWLHGFNGENPVYWKWWWADTRHMPLAERHDIVYVEPHGRGNTSYNGIGDRDVMRCIDLAKQRFKIDDDRVYLTGQSMGGGGTWVVASRHPGMFAAIAPVFGGFDYHIFLSEDQLAKLTPRERAQNERQSSYVQSESLLNTPIYVNHGDADPSVDVEQSRYAVRMLQRWGYDIRYREHPGKGHGGLGNDDEAIDWLLRYKRNPNPAHVRVRAADLKDAAAYWLRIDQRAGGRDIMAADAEAVGPNAIRLDTANVVAVTLSPGAPLVDPARPLRVSWNGAPARTVTLEKGRVTLFAEGYSRAPGEKSARVAGPIGDALTGPFAVVVGTVSSDAGLRELCSRKAQAIADFWSASQHQPVRLYKDVEIPEADLARYSLLLIGGPDANAVTRKLAASLPLRISGGEVVIAGRTFEAPDAAVTMIHPNPLNPERYVVVTTSTSPAGMNFFSPLGNEMTQFDYVIVDGAVPNAHRGRTAEKVRLAAGLFDRNWKIDDKLLDRGDPEVRARCPRAIHTADGVTALVGGKPLSAEVLDAYAGTYQVGNAAVPVVRRGACLAARPPNQQLVALVPESETAFVDESGTAEVTFVKDDAGKVTAMKLKQRGGVEVTAPRVK
jgi:dienelactone hydrolase